jgi:hypothetical protein
VRRDKPLGAFNSMRRNYIVARNYAPNIGARLANLSTSSKPLYPAPSLVRAVISSPKVASSNTTLGDLLQVNAWKSEIQRSSLTL